MAMAGTNEGGLKLSRFVWPMFSSSRSTMSVCVDAVLYVAGGLGMLLSSGHFIPSTTGVSGGLISLGVAR